MKLIVITSPRYLPYEAENITRLFHAGLDILHLRKPQSSYEELEHLLRQLPEETYPHIVLHDHFPLAQLYGLRGVHLNARNPQSPPGFQGSVSRSCHSIDEVARYKPQYSYVFLSPIYDSISKEGYNAAYSPAELQEAHRAGIIDRQVIALGGINQNNLPEIHTYGFGGAALLGDIWQQSDNNFIPHFNALKQLANQLP